jgi:hypothetical protein
MLKVSSALHGERIWRRIGTRDHVTRDGRTVLLSVWQSSCGDPFEVTTPSSVEQSNSFLQTTCPAHRMTPSEAGRLRFAKKGQAPEGIRTRKLARGQNEPASGGDMPARGERSARWFFRHRSHHHLIPPLKGRPSLHHSPPLPRGKVVVMDLMYWFPSPFITRHHL